MESSPDDGSSHYPENPNELQTASRQTCLASNSGGIPENGAADGPISRLLDGEIFNRRFAVISLSIGTVLLFADQNLMSPNLTAIADEFGFDAIERDRKLGGDIALAFFVLGAPASLIIGCLADTVKDRTRLYAVTIMIGEGSCLLTYWIQTYAQLYACRAITGISVGGALPLVFSILGDMFPADQRHKVSSLVGIGVGAGISVGQGIAGFLGPKFGWRIPFVVVSVPAILCALVVWLFVDEPKRGAAEEAILRRTNASEAVARPLDRSGYEYRGVNCTSPREGSDGPNSENRQRAQLDTAAPRDKDPPQRDFVTSSGVGKHWETFQSLMRTPTVVLALLQGAPGCIPWGVVNVFLADFLSENRGMSIELATVVLLVFGFGNFLGLLIGGFWGSHLYSIDKRFPSLLAGLAAMMGTIPFWVLLNAVYASSSVFFTYPVSMVSGFLAGITGPIVKATLQNVTQPDGRGQAFALYNTFDDFGRGLGPVFVAMMVSSLGGRTQAFNLGVSGWLLCGILNLAMFFFVQRDEERIQTELEAIADGVCSENGIAMHHVHHGVPCGECNKSGPTSIPDAFAR